MAHLRSAPPAPHPLAALAVLVLGSLAMVGVSLAGTKVGMPLRVQIAAATLALAVPPAVLLAARPRWITSVMGGGGWPPARLAGLAALFGAASWVFSVGLMQLQSLLLPPPPAYLEMFRRIHQALAPANPLDALVSLLVIAALPGLCEEFLMRGVLLSSLQSRVGAGVAVGVSALLFAVIHFDVYRFLFTLAVGLLFGLLRVRTGTLWSAVVAHLTLNGITFTVAPFVDAPGQPERPDPLLGMIALLAGGAGIGALLRTLRGSARAQTAAAD